MFLERLILGAALFLGVTGCMAESSSSPPSSPADGGTAPDATTEPPPEDELVPSSKARLRFIGGERLSRRLAGALELPVADICRELGQYDCVADVHTITLAGVEPYRLGIREPNDGTASTTPIAVERVALSACTARAEQDFADLSSAVVFSGLALDDGRLADVAAPEVQAMLDGLYRRLLQRPATESEIAHLRSLYEDMAEIGDPQLALRWATVSCFAVATTVEALFY